MRGFEGSSVYCRFAGSLLLTFGFANQPDVFANEPDNLAQQAGQILNRYCSRCHNGEGSDSGYAFNVRNTESLVGEGVVVAKDAASSQLYRDLENGRMPPKNQPHLPKPSPAEALIVKNWIESGAATIPKPEKRVPFVGIKDNLTAIRDHFSTLTELQRRTTRYFTLTNLWNDSSVDDDHLRNVRAGLSKVLNSLSWAPEIVLPEAVDDHGIVYAVDISKLQWTREHWNALVKDYPYGLSYGSHPDRELKKLDDEITSKAKDSQLLHLRADWLVSNATKPRLYHKLLYELVIPDLVDRVDDLSLPANPKRMSDADLEKFLGVNVTENLFGRGGRVVRSGFTQSGISGQNRMLEVHEISKGRYYWKSYDFLASTRESILAEFPLGPLNEKNAFAELAFRHDGGEMIFTLPNGMQGYLLASAAGLRLDAGPIEIVGDSLRTSGTQAIVTGLSCIACHRVGMVEPPSDEIREFASVFGAARERVEQLYLPKDEMSDLISSIQTAFKTSCEKATGSFLVSGNEQRLEFDRFQEPVAEVSRRFLLESLNIEAIACELDESNPGALLNVLKKSRTLRGLGLNVLTRDNGVVKRDAWESRAAFSMMQETARELSFGPSR